MTLPGPCRSGLKEHCGICMRFVSYICCECGCALPPWHPDIQGLVMDGKVAA